MADITKQDFKEAIIEGFRGIGTQGALLTNQDLEAIRKYFNVFKDSIEDLRKRSETLNKETEIFGNQVNEIFKNNKEELEKYEVKAKQVAEIGKNGDSEGALKALDDLIKTINEDSSVPKQLSDNLKSMLSSYEKLIKNQKEYNVLIQKQSNEQDVLNRLIRTNEQQVDNFFSNFGLKFMGERGAENPLFMGLQQLFSEGRTNLLQAGFDIKIRQIKNFLNPLNIGINLLQIFKNNTIELFGVLDKTTASFQKATGQGDRFNDSILSSWRSVRYFMVSLEEISAQYESLLTNVQGFTSQAEASQMKIAAFGAVVSRLGVGVDEVSRIFSFFMDGLKQGPKEAQSGFERLLGISKVTGQNLKQITHDFLSALPEIAKYGNQTVSVFAQMAGTAKALKIETGDLLNIAKGFDTFETAASSVGRLNAILGGPYLNTLQLMNQNEAERVQTLYSAFKATGRNWEALGKYERQAIATAAGISDMNVANKLFAGSLSDLGKYTREQSLHQDELNERNQRAATLAEKWGAFMSSLSVVLSPVLDILHKVLTFFLDISDKLSFLGPILVWTLGAFAGFKILRGVTSLFSGLLNVVKGFAGAGNIAAKVTENLGEKLTRVSSPGLFSKITGFFTGIGTAVASVAKSVFGILPIIGAEIVSFATAISAAAPQILIAAGVIAASIVLIGGAIKAVSAFGDFLGDIFHGLGDLFSESPLEEFENEMEDLVNVLDRTSNNFSQKLSGLNALLQSTKDLGKINIEPSLDALSRFIENTIKISPEVMQTTAQTISNITQLSAQTKAQAAVAGGNNLNAALSNAVNKSADQPIHIVVKIGDDILVDKTIKALDAKGNVRVYGVDYP